MKKALVPLPGPKAIKFLTDADLASLPAPTWLVEGILPAKSFSVLFGESGIGKSFLALDIACHLASGLPWRGLPSASGSVVYLAAEGVYGMSSRVSAWKSYHGLDRPLSISWIPDPINLFLDGPNQLIDGLLKLPEPPILLVIDTLACCMVGGDENLAKDMGKFIDSCEAVKKTIGCTVMPIHHPDKSNKYERGSGSLRAASDALIEVATMADETIRVNCLKMKDSEPFKSFAFEKTPESPSIVLTYPDRPITLKPAVQKTLDCLRQRPLSPNEWLRAAIAAGIAERTFWRYKKELSETGLAIEASGVWQIPGGQEKIAASTESTTYPTVTTDKKTPY